MEGQSVPGELPDTAKESDTGLILDVQTQLITTDSNQLNANDAIEAIIDHEQKTVNCYNHCSMY